MNILKHNQTGFTLIEIAIVVMVFGLILGGVLSTVGVQRQQLKRDETRQLIETIKESLLGFALSDLNGRLPCPDTDGDGVENVTAPPASVCVQAEGFLPFGDIGVGNFDAWGNRFRYRVTTNFADSSAPAFGMADPGDITINSAAGTVASSIPAVIVSYGANGVLTINSLDCAVGVPSSVEDENCNNDPVFYDDIYSNVAGNEYDDLVSWIPLTMLKSRMVEAGKLP